MYFEVGGVRYWIMPGPSGLMLYRKEGSRSKYLGRISIAEIKEMLAKADAEEVQRLKAELEAMKQAVETKQAVESQKTTAQTSQPSLTWRKDDHTYWILQYGASFYIYMKGPSTRHKPRLIEKTDINGVINHVAAADALHVLEALRALVNDLHAAVSDLTKPPAEAPKKPPSQPQEAQASRKEAEEALRELKRELSRAAKKWDEELKRRASWGGPDRKWIKDKLSEFINDNSHLVEKILPHQDLLNKFADTVAEATAGYLTRTDVWEILKEL
jgi:DNA-binding transcriptional MerR regulator